SHQSSAEKLYRPVSCISFALNYFFGELNVFGYHLVNIFIHLIASIFLFLFIYHLLNFTHLSSRYKENSYFIALLATVLWAINPIQTQAVTYIVQRMASLAGMFYIMSMYFYLRARTAQAGSKNISLHFLSFITFLLAFGSKENAVLLPFSIILLEIFILNCKPLKKIKEYPKTSIIVFLIIILTGIFYILINDINIYERFFDGYKNRPFTVWERLMTQPRVLILYISLILYPVSTRLNISHDIDVSTSLFTPVSTIISILALAALIVFAVKKRNRYPLLCFSTCFLFLNHAIESSFFNLELIYEHRNYIPSMFFFLPIVAGLYMGLDYYKNRKRMRYVIILSVVLILVGLGHSTFIRNFTWKNEKSLWIDAVDKSPKLSRPHHNLGKYYHDHGYFEEALSEYSIALKFKQTNRNDEFFASFYNIGKLFADINENKKAEVYYKKAIKIEPSFPAAYNNLATLYDKEGDIDLANKYLIKSFKLEPFHPVTNQNLGLLFLKMNKPEKAIFHLNRSNIYDDSTGVSLSYMGIANKKLGRYGKAVIYFKKAIQKNPNNIIAILQLAEIYQIKGHREMADQQINDALALMLKDNRLFTKSLDSLKNEDLKNLNPSLQNLMPIIKKSMKYMTEELNKWE
ncbi:MAG: tetratricopeptide repeat protein, partial [Deltaproteobacteria bacterium]|nr:tetratricopeptide repeat protein [Deltaproteobacteria bacterium]